MGAAINMPTHPDQNDGQRGERSDEVALDAKEQAVVVAAVFHGFGRIDQSADGTAEDLGVLLGEAGLGQEAGLIVPGAWDQKVPVNLSSAMIASAGIFIIFYGAEDVAEGDDNGSQCRKRTGGPRGPLAKMRGDREGQAGRRRRGISGRC